MKIIINADDFGLSRNTNESIIYCHQKGCLTSASLLAYGAAFDEAVELAKENPELGIGVHLTLDGKFDNLYQNKTLYKREKEFYSREIIIDYLKKFKFNTRDIIEEYSSQIEKILDKNIKISHIDHHHHLHLYFQALKAVIFVAKKYKIRFVRSQKIIMHHNKSVGRIIYRNLHQFYLILHNKTVNGYYDLVYKKHDNYNYEKERLKELLSMNIKKVEIITHPTFKDDFETSFLTNKEIMDLFKHHKLVNYRQI